MIGAPNSHFAIDTDRPRCYDLTAMTRGLRNAYEMLDPDYIKPENRTGRIFKELDLPGMLADTGLSPNQISVVSGVSRSIVYRLMGKGEDATGEWSNGMHLYTISKLLGVCGQDLVISSRPFSNKLPSEPLYLNGPKWHMLTPNYGPVRVQVVKEGPKGAKLTNTREFETMAHAYYAQKLLPQHWQLAHRSLTRFMTIIKNAPPEWKERRFSPAVGMRNVYLELLKDVPSLAKTLVDTGERELRWECSGKHHEQFHELGACRKCNVQGNLVGDILMQIREEVKG